MKQRIETIDDSPILIIKRDEPIAKVEEVKVVNNVAILSECPYHFTKVRIKDMFEIPEDVYRNNKEIKENQYVVDYKFGFITFNPIMEGRTLTVEYDGTGTVLIPSSRIYDTGREDVIITLQEMIDGGRKAIEAYGNIDNAILIAKEEYAKINTSIEEGKKVNNDLNITIINAKDINKILEGNIYKANNINNTLNGSIASGTNKIQEMDNKISEVDNNETIRKSNEEERRNSENIRISNENERKSNEITRSDNENKRKSDEANRENNEVARQNAENKRMSNEDIRINNENKRIQSETIREANEKDRQNTNNKMINTINDISICEEYNENKEYKKLNRVTYNGSSYECKKDCENVNPTNTGYWICIAEKGKDGLGSGNMHTSTYDKNGNGIVDIAEIAESVEWEDVKNKPDLSEIGKVKSVNGKTGEVILTAEDIKTNDGKTIENFKTYVIEQIQEKATSKTIKYGDFNSIKEPGLYTMFNCTNHSPEGRYNSLIVLNSSSSTYGIYGHQISINEDSNKVYLRGWGIGTWTPWKQIINEDSLNEVKKEIEAQILDLKNNHYTKTETDNKFATKDDLGNINVPVTKINGKTGDVELIANDIIVTELGTTVEEAILNNHTNVDGAIEDIKNINSQLADKATKDGTLQTNLNSEKLNNKTASKVPLTGEKTDLIGMINEVFTSGNNVKYNTVDALLQLDKSLQINKDSNWQDVINNISKVSTGKKYATGTSTKLRRETQVIVRNLNFKPRIVLIVCSLRNGKAVGWIDAVGSIIIDNSLILGGNSKINGFYYSGFQSPAYPIEYDLWGDGKYYLYNDGFSCPASSSDEMNFIWYAFE